MTTRLSDLCDLVAEQVHPSDFDDECVYLGLEHLAPARLMPVASGLAADVNSHKFRFGRGDVLYGKLRPYLDKAVLADSDGVCTTELLVLRPKADVDPRFLACVLHAPEFIRHAMAGVTGAHHPRTSWAHVAQFELPNFDKKAQRSLAALLWQVHDLASIALEAKESASAVKRDAMRELFTRGLRGEAQRDTEIGLVPESWETVSLASLAKVRGGTSFPPALQGKNRGDLPFYKVSDMNLPENEVEMRSAINWIDREDLDQLRAKPLPPDTIIFPKVGAALHTNKKRLLSIESLVDNNIMGVMVLDPERCLPKYLFGWFQTFNLSSIANAGPLPSINGGQLYELKLPIPRLDEQHEIVATLDAIDRKIDLHRQKHRVLQELFKSLLHKLLTGEISVSDLDLSALPLFQMQPAQATA